MKRASTIFGATLLLLGRLAAAADIAGTDWNSESLARLNGVDKAAVVAFVNAVPGNTGDMQSTDLLDFRWVDLAGDGKAALVMLTATGPCCANVLIYRRAPSGAITQEVLPNVGVDLRTGIRDLDGDGKSELIARQDVDALDGYRGIRPAALWTAVYRFKKGKYVEASREFTSFYDAEVLPKLDAAVARANQRVAALPADAGGDEATDARRKSAVLEVERNKTLRILGRPTTTGLSKAREWVTSSDPDLVADAMIVLRATGSSERELRAAQEALERARERERTAHP